MEFSDIEVVDHRLPDSDALVRELRLARPAKKNAFSVGLASDLALAVRQADELSEVRAILVTAQGDVFSAGADLSLFLGQSPDVGERGPDSLTAPDRVHECLQACRTPLIAVVAGKAVGMGVTLLPHFDLVYASERASFDCPFVKLGLVLEFGSSFSLPRLIGRQRTNELMLRAKPIDAQTAERWGLVTRLFPHDSLFQSALEIAQDIARLPPGGVQKTKALIRQGEQTAEWSACLAAEDGVLQSCYGSDENVRAAMEFFSRKG
ncbi:MAG: enoyl-CoA hydratase/isomerase family protein [Polyangiaceae bacterium]|nr:enoyl-CoA hydratase/isomerase family protein [Polyangiaceae bacterium]